MKKYSILKALGITFLVVALLSWIIPAGTYSNGTYQSIGSTLPIGLYDFIRVPVLTIPTFIQYGVLLLAIGGFYGVVNKTSAYSTIVNNVVEKWSKNKKKFLIITALVFSVLASVTGLEQLLLLLAPFFIAILLKLGFSKMTSFVSTIGAMLVGNIGSTIGFNTWGYLMNYFSLDMTTLLFARIVLFIMAIVLLIITLSKSSKDEVDSKKSKEALEIPLYEDTKGKKEVLPLIILSVVLLVLILLGGYNWYYSFNIEFFSDMHENISAFEIGGYPIINNLLALENVPALGFFGNYDIVVILIFASLIIGWIYSVSIKDMISSFAKGAKEMLLPAIYAMLSCVVFATILNMSEGSFVDTMINKILAEDKFSFMGTVGTSLITSFVYNDLSTLLTNVSSIFTVYDTNVIPIIALIFQGIFGLISLIAPTSVYLLAGLAYMDISYKEWVKYIWKYTLILFGIVLVIAFILVTLI